MVFIITRGKEHIFAEWKTTRVYLYPMMNPYRYVDKKEYYMQVAWTIKTFYVITITACDLMGKVKAHIKFNVILLANNMQFIYFIS